MKQQFNMNRMILVFKKFWFEHRKEILFMYLAVAALLSIWMSVYLSFRNPGLFRESFQIGYYSIGLLLSGCLSANFLFAELRNKPQAINLLLLPASQLEKIICALFFGVLFYWLGYTFMFVLVDSLFVTAANSINETHWPIINPFRVGRYEDTLLDQFPSPYALYFAFQALFILGSVYFKSYSFFKTSIVLLFIWILFLAAPMVIATSVPLGAFNEGLFSYEIFDAHGNIEIEMPTWFAFAVSIFFGYIITGTLWLTTYFRLKERQIN